MFLWKPARPAAFCIVIILALSLLTWPRLTTTQAQTEPRCFSETNMCIEGRIREFWEQNGGLAVFGFPITPQINETIENTSRPVQWFERNRLEVHSEKEVPYDVLLGRLGVDALEQQGRSWFSFEPSAPQAGCLFFEQTEQNICEPFLSFWRANGLEFDGVAGTSEAESLALFGLPISGRMTETIELADGTTRQLELQWFERARFEYHPDNPPEAQVLLGLLGNEVRLGNGPAAPAPGDGGTAGSQLAFTSLREGNQDVYICDLAADGQSCLSETRLTNIPQNDGQPAWSPDGSQLAFESDLDGDWEVYTINSNGSGQFQLTNNTTTDGAPSWAALATLGWRVALHSDRGAGNFDIFLLDSLVQEGSAANSVQLTSDPADDRHPALSPDGQRIAFSSTRGDGISRIYVADLVVGEESVTLANLTSLASDLGGNSQKPVWSPDTTRLLFENEQGSNAEIYVINADGSGLQNLTAHDAVDGHPTWSPDGQQIAFQSNRDGDFFTVYVMNADGSNPVQLVSHQPADAFHPAWMPMP